MRDPRFLLPKPEPRQRTKGRRERLARAETRAVREYVFMRERNICRCCRVRPAESMHEMIFRSQGKAGRPSRINSIAVCGSGTTRCHGFLQAHQIDVSGETRLDAERCLYFSPMTLTAAAHLRVPVGFVIVSCPMREVGA